ncbi:hypothetical protein ABPG75_005863 [Micractinium tetrahymenae]
MPAAGAAGPSGLDLLKTAIAVLICSLGAGSPELCGGGAVTAAAAAGVTPTFDLKPVLAFAGTQLKQEIKDFPPGSDLFPGQNTTKDGSWAEVAYTDWVSGFGDGCLWKMHALTGNASWAKTAAAVLPDLEPMKTNTGTHDIGFVITSSFGNALDAQPPPSQATADTYRKVLQTAAGSLAKRYNPKLKLIRSWGSDLAAREFKVIIDNMMNLQLLFRAAALPGGKSAWCDIAAAHATTTSKVFFRSDGSTYHKVIYDAQTGKITCKGTYQGYSDKSTWTRVSCSGQAWALYGFTAAYEATTAPLFLATAQKAADLFLKRLTPDWVPLWDFDAPKSQSWKDTSAGAIAAAGLLRLSKVAPAAAGSKYKTAALAMLEALATKYPSSAAPPGSPRLASILMNGTVSAPAGMYGTGTIFGDYYFLEALHAAYGRQAAA